MEAVAGIAWKATARGWSAGRGDDQAGGVVKEDLTGVKIDEPPARRGVAVPLRTVQRYVLEVCGRAGRRSDVRIADGAGDESAGRLRPLGFIADPATVGGGRGGVDLDGREQPATFRVVELPSDDESGDRRLRGGVGVLRGRVRHPDPRNPSAVVDDVILAPRFNQAFVEYAEVAASHRSPPGALSDDKPTRWSGAVSFVRDRSSRGDVLVDLADAQRRAEVWCRGTLRACARHDAVPAAEVLNVEVAPPLPADRGRYDLPIYAPVKVDRTRSASSCEGAVLGAGD